MYQMSGPVVFVLSAVDVGGCSWMLSGLQGVAGNDGPAAGPNGC